MYPYRYNVVMSLSIRRKSSETGSMPSRTYGLKFAWPPDCVWRKPVILATGSRSEMKCRRCASPSAPGYRLYFTRRGCILIVMLAGGDKSTQPRDIKRAQRILRQLELEP
jgi:hypothetical protein